MKKGMFLALAVLFTVAGMIAVASAAQNVANTSQKGSLLVFPKIDLSDNKDTIVEINNDSAYKVRVQCYWVNEFQEPFDFSFWMTPFQPVWFSARSGDGMGFWLYDSNDAVSAPPFNGERGELKCWAVNNDSTQQISHNHLYGKATIIDWKFSQSWEYNSWNFAAKDVARGKCVGPAPGQLVLNGQSGYYDACPKYLVGDFVALGAPMALDTEFFGEVPTRIVFGAGTDLTLVPCIQDLRQNRQATYTKATFTLWNEDEVSRTGIHQCIKCWFESYLDQIGPKNVVTKQLLPGVGGKQFVFDYLKTPKGRYRVIGLEDDATCKVDTVRSPLLGVQSQNLLGFFYDFALGYENDPAYYSKRFMTSGSNLNTAGIDPIGIIKWDPGMFEEESIRK